MVLSLIGCNANEREVADDAVHIRITDNSELGLEILSQMRPMSNFEGFRTFNVLTDEIIDEFLFDSNVIFWNPLIDLAEKGYYGTIVRIAQDAGNDDFKFLLLDQQLNVVNEFELDNDTFSGVSLLSADVAYKDGELLLYFRDSNETWEWDNIYVYNIHTHERTLLFEMEEVFFVWELSFLNHYNQLVLLANHLDNDNLYYGVIDLETKELTLFYESGFEISEFEMVGNYLVMTGVRNYEQNEIIIFDAISGDKRINLLNDREVGNPLGIRTPSFVKMTNDGRFVLAVSFDIRWCEEDWTAYVVSDNVFITVYSARSGVILFEYTLLESEFELEFNEELANFHFIAVDDGVHALVFRIETKLIDRTLVEAAEELAYFMELTDDELWEYLEGLTYSELWSYRDFVIENTRFHTIFIVIEELEE